MFDTRLINPQISLFNLTFANLLTRIKLLLVGFLSIYSLGNAIAQAQPIRNAQVIELPAAKSSQHAKVALVIGNARYIHAGALTNPVHDATDLAAKLTALGFTDTILAINQTNSEMKQTLRTFRSRLRPNAEVVVYYAGHGMSVDGTNYLLPIDAKLETKADLEDEAIALKRIIKDINDAQVKTSVVILDSCRNNPLSRGWKASGRDIVAKGWGSEAIASAATGIKIFYATKDGEVAYDGEGRNGVFTSSLLRHIETPGLSLNDMIDQVTLDLRSNPKAKQTPWSEGSMIGAYYFKPPAVAAKFAALRAKVLAGDVQAADEWIKTDPDAAKNLELLMSKIKRSGNNEPNRVAVGSGGNSAQANTPQPSPSVSNTPTDKQTVAIVLAQEQSEDSSQRKLGAAMSVYVVDKGKPRAEELANMMAQGNEFAALMLHRLELVNKEKSPVLIPQAMLTNVVADVERLSQMGDLVAISWHANLYRDGLLGKTKDDKKAFDLMKLAAEKNYPYAQYVLGFFHLRGRGTPINGEQAKNWYQKAIVNGITEARVDLGSMYADGNVVAKNEAEALKLFKKAADENNQYGQSWLGYAYRDGKLGLKPDGEQAKNWYQKAIDNGSTDAMVNLGWMYEQGKIVAKNEAEALKLYQKAATANNKSGQRSIGRAYSSGLLGLKQDGEQAMSWYQKAIDNGSTEAMVDLGSMYADGNVVAKNEAEALKLFKKAADENNQYGQSWLGYAYRDGKLGLKPDGEQAKNWYQKAIDNGSTDAMVNLGWMYEQGKIVAKNEAEALKQFKKAAESGDHYAQNWLGYAYREGALGLTQDFEQAKNWYTKSIENGNIPALNALGWMYEHGKGIPKDEAKAVELFKKAADAQNATGIYNLGIQYWAGKGGLSVDKAEANRLFRIAADMGQEDAIKFLAK